MGTETIGPRGMVQGADSFGFDGAPPIDLPGPVAESTFRPLTATSSDPARDFTRDLPILAQSSIGQADVKASPLEMALVASAIANNGVIMAPHVLREVRDAQGALVKTYPVRSWRSPISAASAATMRDAMRQVVQSGTATIMQEPGFDVGAKTGTAEIGTPQQRSNNAWMVAWAGAVGAMPDVVVAVVVPDVPGYGNNSTGAAVAGPAAHEILTKALAILHPAAGTTPSTTPAN
jgi:peptidoglycan glycosyltransferase